MNVMTLLGHREGLEKQNQMEGYCIVISSLNRQGHSSDIGALITCALMQMSDNHLVKLS